MPALHLYDAIYPQNILANVTRREKDETEIMDICAARQRD